MTTYFAPQTDLQLTRFKRITHTHGGKAHKMPFATWVQQRTAAAATNWPSAAELSEELEQYRRGVAEADAEYHDDLLAENEKLWAASVKAAKLTDVEAKALTVEVGAVLTGGRRADDAVTMITWLFIDIDGIERDRLSALVAKLRASGLCFYATESATSRLPLVATDKTGPYKVHTYVPVTPIILPSGVPATEIKEWWCKVYAAAVTGLLAGVVDKHDASVDDLSQPCFVAQVPPSGDRRAFAAVTDGNYLDVEAYITSLGHTMPRPLPATAQAKATEPQVAATTITTQTTPRPVTVSAGPTPGETTGSLVHRAIRGLGMLGRMLDAKRGLWSCRCPWHTDHQTDPNQTVLDSSTVIFENGSVDGGFDCKHNGCRAANGGIARTAADVLSLARRRGVDLPDRASYGAPLGASVVEAAQEAAESKVAADGNDDDRPAPKPRKHDARLRIVVQDDRLADMRDAAISSLTRRGDIFAKDGGIVDVTASGLRITGREHLAAILSETARFVRVSVDKEGNMRDKAVEAPRNVVEAVLKLGRYAGLRPLRAVITNPAMLASGRVVDAAGYDTESHLLYQPTTTITVPSSPTKADAEAAKARLMGYVKHTVWTDDRGPSIWLSLVLTLAGRAAFPTAPSFGFDAAAAASGKTSLIKIAHGLIFGDVVQLQPPPVGDDAELEKRLPQWSRSALVCFDNLKSTLASPIIDAAITAGRTEVRRLSKNEALVCDFTSTTFAYTGNNITVGDDAASRTLIARIKPPTTRKFDFAVDDADFYRAQRPGAVADALTILRAFVIAGSPQSEGPYCRFVEWSRLIRGAVKWLGMADPVGGEVVDTNDEARSEALHALAAWRQSLGDVWATFFAGELDPDRRQGRDESDDAYRIRRRVVDALSEIAGKRVESDVQVGRAFQRLRDGILKTESRAAKFTVEDAKPKKKYRFVVAESTRAVSRA